MTEISEPHRIYDKVEVSSSMKCDGKNGGDKGTVLLWSVWSSMGRDIFTPISSTLAIQLAIISLDLLAWSKFHLSHTSQGRLVKNSCLLGYKNVVFWAT